MKSKYPDQPYTGIRFRQTATTFRNRSTCKGFTLIELLVVIAIIWLATIKSDR